jgi:hypothetical protein
MSKGPYIPLLDEAQRLLGALGSSFSGFGKTIQNEMLPQAGKLADSLQTVLNFHTGLNTPTPDQTLLDAARKTFGMATDAPLADVRARVQDRLGIVIDSVRDSAPIKTLERSVAPALGNAVSHLSHSPVPAGDVSGSYGGAGESYPFGGFEGGQHVSALGRVFQRHDAMLATKSPTARFAIGAAELGVGSILMNMGGHWISQSFNGYKSVDPANSNPVIAAQIEPLSVPDRMLKAALGVGGMALGATAMFLGARTMFNGHE